MKPTRYIKPDDWIGRIAFSLSSALLLNCSSGCTQSTRVGNIEISVDPRIELFSTACRLAEFNEYNMTNTYKKYYDLVGQWFNPYSSNELIGVLKELRELDGISFNAPMGLAVYLKDCENCETRVPFDQMPTGLDLRWTASNVDRVLPLLKEFAQNSQFNEFFKSQEPMYKVAVSRFCEILKQKEVAPWFDQFFGKRPSDSFTLILGLQNGGANYAASVTLPGSSIEMYAIIGCYSQDSSGLPVFDDKVVSIVVHEFCHCYTNPMVDDNSVLFEEAGKKIFEKVNDMMTNSAYGDWKTMIQESFVRACVLRFLLTNKDKTAYQQDLEKNLKLGFFWIGELADLLADYENNRNRYPSFIDFVPRISEFFNQYDLQEIDVNINRQNEAKKEMWEKSRLEGPGIVNMIPDNGAMDVDPELTEIRITFDREMASTYCTLYKPGEEDMFPEVTGTAYWDSTKRIYVMPVKLKPNWSYTFGLNWFNAIGFKDEKGNPLYPMIVKFKTRAE